MDAGLEISASNRDNSSSMFFLLVPMEKVITPYKLDQFLEIEMIELIFLPNIKYCCAKNVSWKSMQR